MDYHTSVVRRLMRYLFPLIFLVISVLPSSAITVSVSEAGPSWCMEPVGILHAWAAGGTAPYHYDWYRMNGSSSTLICLDCTEERGGLAVGEYKVVVTDALNATAQAFGYVSLAEPAHISQSGYIPYLAGTAPVVYGEMQQIGFTSSTLEVTPSGISGSVNTFRTFQLPIGTTTAFLRTLTNSPPMVAQVCPIGDTEVLYMSPTVLPTLTPLQIEPSCSNGSTGRVDFVLTNGTIPAGIHVHLRSGGTTVRSASFTASTMPTAMGSFTGVAPGSYQLVVSGSPNGFPYNLGINGFNYTCRDSVPVTVPSNGAVCGSAQGYLFLDGNLNCTKQSQEPFLPRTMMMVMPGQHYVMSNTDGTFSFQLPAGSYTLHEQHPQLALNCSPGGIPFTLPASLTPVLLNVPCTSTVAMDAEIRLGSGPARPGFELEYGLLMVNNTPPSTGVRTVTVQLDPALSFLSASPAPTTVSGNTLTWNLAALGYYGTSRISLRTQVPADVGLLGTSLNTVATLATTVTDGVPANNVAVHTVTVTGSYDPNDKLAMTSSGSGTHFDAVQDEWIEYTIRFQNTGTDTAFNVVITDTLPATLDPGSVTVGAASDPYTWSMQGSGVLRFQFLNLRLPHMSVNEPASHGFVCFRVKAVQPLAPGTSIANRANIYFDFNPPIITDLSVLNVPAPPVLVSPRVYLGGPFSGTTPPMNDALRIQNLLPYMEPYTRLGYAHVASGGGELASPAAFQLAGGYAIVDWVVVELREPSGSGALLASRAALLQRDGDVVGPNGTSPVAFNLPTGGSYRIAVRHRNHLGVMTSTSRTLTTAPTVVDFTSPATMTYGTDARNNLNGTMVLWPGDVNDDGVVKYTGAGNDRDVVLLAIGGAVPTSSLNNVYDTRDVNLDGSVIYTGTGNDRDLILQAIGGVMPTAVRTQQLP